MLQREVVTRSTESELTKRGQKLRSETLDCGPWLCPRKGIPIVVGIYTMPGRWQLTLVTEWASWQGGKRVPAVQQQVRLAARLGATI